MSKFKLGLLIVFGLFIVVAIVVFATSKGVSLTRQANVTVLGFLPSGTFDALTQNSILTKDKAVLVTYVEKNPQTFENDFVNALANGVGPDVVMISQDMVLQNQNKLFPIPYKNYN